jgi:hypothetical protein
MNINLNEHLNEMIRRGNPADFRVTLRPIAYQSDTLGWCSVPDRFAVVRNDNDMALSIVSDRYTVVEHQDILDAVQLAIFNLGMARVPSGVFVDKGGARMRALYKFPDLARVINRAQSDAICPCIKIENTYDGSSRVSVHIGAFRLVCTNLAVGGGGVFAGGFMSIHVGKIDVKEVGQQLQNYLSGFEQIVETYRRWLNQTLLSWDYLASENTLNLALDAVPKKHKEAIIKRVPERATVYDAFNAATDYATHLCRTACVAFELLSRINSGFQKTFPA